jgi:hypothetical protein
MANDDWRPTARIQDHLRRILNQHTTPTEAAFTNPVPGAGLQEVAGEIHLEENDLRDAARACDQAAIAMCARPSAANRSSMTVLDPKTGKTVTIEPKPRTVT